MRHVILVRPSPKDLRIQPVVLKEAAILRRCSMRPQRNSSTGFKMIARHRTHRLRARNLSTTRFHAL